MRRVGFIIDGRVPGLPGLCKSHCGIVGLVRGCPSSSSVGLMRFGWIAEQVNAQQDGYVYELYRPWRKYHAVVFLKSMSDACRDLARKLKRQGVRIIFDLNVDYLTPAAGRFFYQDMAPSQEQCSAAQEMTAICNGVIGDSSHLTKVARQFKNCVAWIPDNVRSDLIADHSDWRPKRGEPLPLLWCGEAVKLFELLRIKEVLLEFRQRIRLDIVASSMTALERIFEPHRSDLLDLLNKIQHSVFPFQSVERLLDRYSLGGVFISPRFLCNSYNLGHTEWKISLAMAKSRIALCSEQQSYVDLSERAQGKGIRICRSDDEWRSALADVLSEHFPWEEEQKSAMQVVRDQYSTEKIARKHLQFVKSLLELPSC